jgi:hypothetical protein
LYRMIGSFLCAFSVSTQNRRFRVFAACYWKDFQKYFQKEHALPLSLFFHKLRNEKK